MNDARVDRIDALAARMEEWFRKIEVAFVEQRQFTQFLVQQTEDRMSKRFDALDRRFDRLEARLFPETPS